MRRALIAVALVTTMVGMGVIETAAQSTPGPATPAAVAAAALADPDGTFVEVDGVRLYYVARGPEDGPAVLLLHGVLGSTLDWATTLDPLAEAGYRVVAFDRPPFGLSDKSIGLDYSVAGQADLTVGLMDALGIEQAVLVGHSAGGPVAGSVAERYPDRVAKLVLIAPAYLGLFATATPVAGSPAPPPTVSAEQQRFFNLFAVLFDPASDPNSPADQARLRDAVLGLMPAAADATPAAGVRQDPYRFTLIPGWEAGLLAYGRLSLNDPGIVGPNGEAITAPILLVWGEVDPLLPVAIGDQLRALLPDAAWVSYPGVGHFVPQEVPADFSRDLLGFIAD